MPVSKKQKAARSKFKQKIKQAQKIKKSHPGMKWKDAIKKAWKK